MLTDLESLLLLSPHPYIFVFRHKLPFAEEREVSHHEVLAVSDVWCPEQVNPNINDSAPG